MIFVTGGTGLIGSHLLFDLVSMGEWVRAIVRDDKNLAVVRKIFGYYTDRADELFGRIEWVYGDILDYDALLIQMQGVKQVYHAAALISFHQSHNDNVMNTNIQGTVNIVNASLENKIEKLCHVSSIATLGSPINGEPIDEHTEFEHHGDHSTYSKSKYYSELEVWRGISEGLNAVIVNPSVVLGPGHWQRHSSAFFNLVWNGMKFYTTGTNGYVDVRDVVQCMTQLMNSDISAERFILSSENLSYRDILNMISGAFNKRRPYIYASPFVSSIAWRLEKIRSLFSGTCPRITCRSMKTAHIKQLYSNKKIINAIPYKFRKIDTAIHEIAELFMREQNSTNK
ncbi:MAG: NAD-dependent epimerase/dehydratase family protein [Bacteroidia bacterium]|nr:NAD-dependent epimerase/dehydratase family protein [Bacteroidia bacterium]